MDRVEVVLLGELGQLELAGSRAVLGVDTHLKILLRAVGDDLTEELGELRSVLGFLMGGLLPVQADLRVALAVRNARHGQIHTDLGALALEVGSQTVDDLLLHVGRNVRTERLADADNVLGSPGLLSLLLDELGAVDMAHRALDRRLLAFVNVTTDTANPFFHSQIPPDVF